MTKKKIVRRVSQLKALNISCFYIEKVWKLNINNEIHVRIIKRIILKSIINN